VLSFTELASLQLVDRVIAEKLNAEGVNSGIGRDWTASSVKHVRLDHKIGSMAVQRRRHRLPERHPDGRYSMRGAMKRFGVSHRQVMRWVERGIAQAVREDFEDSAQVPLQYRRPTVYRTKYGTRPKPDHDAIAGLERRR